MPPKKKSSGSAPVAPVGFVLDARELELYKSLDPKIQEKWRIQGQVKDALLGYASMDVLEEKEQLVFGTWNPRVLNPNQVKKLVESFQTEGLERFDLNTVIPVIIPKRFVDQSALVKDPNDPEKLPVFTMPPEIPQDTPIKCAGGRHRVEALEVYMKIIHSEVDEVVTQLDTISKKADDALTDDDKRDWRELATRYKRLGGIKGYGGQWMVAIYDEGESLELAGNLLKGDNIELAQHLSRNATKHVYMETEEEKIVMEMQYIATLSPAKREERIRALRIDTTARKKASKLVTILNSNPAFLAIEQLIEHGPHFMEMPDMNVRWLYKHLCGVHGGLMCAGITGMAEMLDLCFSQAPLSMATVEDLLESRDTLGTDVGGDTLEDAFKSTSQNLVRAKPDRKHIRQLLQSTTLLDYIDSAWNAHMTKPAQDSFACTEDADYMCAYEQYVMSACDELQEYVKREDTRKEVPQTLLSLLDDFPAKFKFISLNYLGQFYGLPVLTQGPLRLLAKHLARIPEALKEISRWFEPLIDYMIAFTKSTAAPSHTLAAINALVGCERLIPKAPVSAILLGCILDEYGACLHLEREMLRVSHTQRVNNSKELGILFPDEKSKKDPNPPTPSNIKLRPGNSIVNQDDNANAKLQVFINFAEELVNAMRANVRARDPMPLQRPGNRDKHGIHLVLSTSWPWRSLIPNSRLREISSIAGAATLEQGIIDEYRPSLLVEDSGALRLRMILGERLKKYLKVAHFVRKSASKQRKDSGFSFPDMLDTSATVPDTFFVGDALVQLQAELSKQSDATLVQNLVKTIERCHLCWRDPSREGGSKSPPLDPKVHDAMEALVHAIEANVHKHYNAGPDESSASPSFHTVFRGTGETTVLPRGKRAPEFDVRATSSPDDSGSQTPQLLVRDSNRFLERGDGVSAIPSMSSRFEDQRSVEGKKRPQKDEVRAISAKKQKVHDGVSGSGNRVKSSGAKPRIFEQS
ncbi:hypothetical protein JVU11DRAFT_10839 [Chiua virens]|nr:hypothetical protein JVU11DRAFT_10839 [Chiua virens]